MAAAGYSVTMSDYDGRTALHLAAAEGHWKDPLPLPLLRPRAHASTLPLPLPLELCRIT